MNDTILNDVGLRVAEGLFRDGLTLDEIAKRGGLEVGTLARLAGLFITRFQRAVLPILIATEKHPDADLNAARAFLADVADLDDKSTLARIPPSGTA
ncbi:hypothetical protein [Methylorubrum extorquens]|uniref:hypothetical protein n=1 Tax=Methylorubrum extorquens TaxID=408 RepID=UPI0011BEB5EB|nr:hypothetical protein [Methylorubrum extorquens]